MGKKRGKQQGAGAATELVVTAATTSAEEETAPSGAISKTQKRKLQKKRAKEAAQLQRAEDAKARARLKQEKAEKAAASQNASVPHPIPQPLVFEVDEEDHCETAPEAYRDIATVLTQIANSLGIEPAGQLRIYDPYYCNGAVVRHLNALGFVNVHNANEDCYARWRAGDVPPHDVVVTNPPYSGDHPKWLMDFLVANGKPWLALMPNWVSMRDYYNTLTQRAALAGGSPFYVVPLKRYNYWTPRGRRADVSSGGTKAKTHGHTNAALGVRTSPFISFWYVGGVPATARAALTTPPDGCRLFWARSELPPAVLRD